MGIKERITITHELHEHNHRYYIEDAPVISDYEFDMLLKELENLESLHPEYAHPNSPTSRVGGNVTKKSFSVNHRYPMLSLSNTYSLEEIQEWILRVEKSVSNVSFVCELKYDGVAIGIRYENGEMVQAVTRGDAVQKGMTLPIMYVPLKVYHCGYISDYPKDFEYPRRNSHAAQSIWL